MNFLTVVAIASGVIIASTGAAVGQGQTSPTADPNAAQNPAIKSPREMTQAPLAKGQNSFNQAEALDRIQSAGYANVTGLFKDTDGLWQAQATYNGKVVRVALDYKGNVNSQ